MDSILNVVFDRSSGGITSLTNRNDPDEMNWAEGTVPWGTLKAGRLTAFREIPNGVEARYDMNHTTFGLLHGNKPVDLFGRPDLAVNVKRTVEGNRLREEYVFTNRLSADVFVPRGGIGIYTPFNDSYEKASVSMRLRCNTHIWCGGACSWVNAVKMGPCDFGLALVLTEGSLDSYSVERDLSQGSNDRGDFLLHPSMVRLLPGESFTVAWELFFYETGHFEEAIAGYESVILTEADRYVLFEGEPISFSLSRPGARVSLDGESIPVREENGRTTVDYHPTRRGEFVFDIEYGGRKTRAEFFVQLPFRELVRRRVRFIVRRQQYHREGSALDGAYLIYDNEDKCLVFDDLFPDFNASRERLVMGLLVARYLQAEYDEEVFRSLMAYYAYVSREFFDEESGTVYNTVGKNPEFKRLYNGPWMGMFLLEMHRVTGDKKYLRFMVKALENYYAAGGYNFYPNGITLHETVTALRDAGMKAEEDRLTEMFRRHAAAIVRNGIHYPEHEVRYEQTIVTPAVNITAQMYLISPDEALADACRLHTGVLERFNGAQPSYKLNEVSLRHWDGYWFGKRMMFGDTMPHAATVHTAVAFRHCALITGDDRLMKRAERCARSPLCLFREDGSASTSYLYPFSVNGVRCEYYDPFANEQDGELYYLLKYFDMWARCPDARE